VGFGTLEPVRVERRGVSRTRLFGALSGHAFLVNFARVVMAPLVAVFIATFGVGEGTAGLVVSAVWVGSALPRIPTGYLLTKLTRLQVVLMAGGILAVGATLTAVAVNVPALVLGAGVMGLSSGLYFVTGNTLVSELFPDRVGRMLGIHGTANQVAAVIAAPVISFALALGADWRPLFVALGVPAGEEWRAVFLALAAAALTLTAATYLLARKTPLPEAGSEDRDLLGAARTEWRGILFGLAVMGTVGFAWQGVFNFYVLFAEARGLSPSMARNALTVVFAAGIPAFAISGRLADRLPQPAYLLGILGASTLLLFALSTVRTVVGLFVLSGALGYVVHSLFPALDTFLLGTFPDENRASAYSVYSGAMMLAQAPGSWFVGTLAEAGVAYTAVFRGFAVAVGLVGIGLLVLHRDDRLPS
jgi:DHA1 family inner membrane transport protein